ncbi:hypothetical protein NMY22_g1476 [Coprinellus aureogranulatus]|nr:hypothetical protein NMY22_g1476 [Coprinellus aureogranulatus]
MEEFPDRRRRIIDGDGSSVCFDSLTSEALSAHHHVPCPAMPPVFRPSVSLSTSSPLDPRPQNEAFPHRSQREVKVDVVLDQPATLLQATSKAP